MVNFATLFFEVARRQPLNPAVTEGDFIWTYGGLAERVGRIGCSLREIGCNHGDRVVLWMENCAEMLELMLACWTAGLCVVPVNARLQSAASGAILLRSALSDCEGCPAALTSSRLSASLSQRAG